MLIIQHIWTKWTKRSRGANAPLRRPRLSEAYRLPEPRETEGVVRHEIRALESEDFALVEELGRVSRDDWERLQPYRDNALDWRLWHDRAEIIIRRPSEGRQQTKWPAHLPVPLFTLEDGETARIEWNGRFMSSMSGRNRASYYEQHVYWLAVIREPRARLFLDAKPKKTIDLRTEIY
ncbi:MAG TPA: hypothetical protein VFO69_01720 [Allosphingosinicella sp.]|nr:hypothetical protein [Allosphingosinicella sp.]